MGTCFLRDLYFYFPSLACGCLKALVRRKVREFGVLFVGHLASDKGWFGGLGEALGGILNVTEELAR